jgi:hypothetical protein
MDIGLLQIIKDNPIPFTIGVAFTLISAAVQTAKGVIDFHEDLSVTRYLNKLKLLLEHADANSVTHQYIKAFRENETFLIVSGIDSYPEKAKMLIDIYLHGVASKRELKRLTAYLKPHGNMISIKVDVYDKIMFMYSFVSMLGVFSYGVYLGLSNLIPFKYVQSIAGIILMFAFLFAGTLLGRDYVTLRILSRVRERLIELDKVINPADSIEWNPILWQSKPIAQRIGNPSPPQTP